MLNLKRYRWPVFLCTLALLVIIPQAGWAESYTDPGFISPYEQALIYVYQQNPQLNAERNQLKILDERVSQALSGFRPNVAANAGTGEQRESVAGSPWVSGDATELNATVTQPLFSFGSLSQRRAADARVRAGRAHLLATEQSVFLAAIGDWLDICEKEKVVGFNQQNVNRMGQVQSATQERVNLGEATTIDLSQSQSRLAEAEARLAIASADLETSRAIYERDVGLEPPNVVEFPIMPIELPQSREETIELARNNPELIEASQAEEAADHDIDAAASSRLPNIFLRGSMSEDRSPELGLDRQRDDSITINLSMPLYQGGAEYSREREAKIAHAKTRQDSMIISRNVTERASQSWSSYYAARAVIAASDKAVAAAIQVARGMEEEQKQGTRTLTEVLDAEAQLLQSQITEAEAQKNVHLEAARLVAAAGKLTAAQLRLKAPLYDPEVHYNETTPRWFGTDP